MPQHVIMRRFRSRARIITTAAFALAALIVVGGALLVTLTPTPHDGIGMAHGVASLAVVALLLSFGLSTRRLARTLQVLSERNPDGLVLLARRLPPVVADLPSFMRSKGVDVQIGDGWYGAVADERGISVHSTGAHPREIVLMEWAELGDISLVRTSTVGGDSRWSIAVDVKPYPTPMIVDLGAAAGIVTMPFGAADTVALLEAVETHRPAPAR